MNREEIRAILEEKLEGDALNVQENTGQFTISTIRPNLKVELIVPLSINELFFEASTLDKRFTLKDYAWFEDEDFRDGLIFYIDILENHEMRLNIMNHHKGLEYLDNNNEWKYLIGMDIKLERKFGQLYYTYLKWFAVFLSIVVLYVYLFLI